MSGIVFILGMAAAVTFVAVWAAVVILAIGLVRDLLRDMRRA